MKKKIPSCSSQILGALLLAFFIQVNQAAEDFVVWSAEPGFEPPPIVVQFDPKADSGFNWKKCENRPWHDSSDEAIIGMAVEFLREGIEKTTGHQLEIINSNDLSKGIIFTTLENAGEDIRNDSGIQKALKNDGADRYNDREAFYLRSEPDRLLVVANTVQGLAVAVPELLESVGYEVLGMGPNWIHIPGGGRERLAFQIERSDRPGYYLRGLNATSGQSYGVGTIKDEKHLSDPADETVFVSYRRWQLGQRLRTRSMPPFPGHAIQAYHRAAVEHIRQSGNTDGFLGDVKLGPKAERPPADDSKTRQIWINSDPEGTSGHGEVYFSKDGQWKKGNLLSLPVNLDLSVPAIRKIIFERFIEKSERFFENSPDKVFIFGTDPEDGGGYAVLGELLKNKNWYPDYLAANGRNLGEPYLLHGYNGLDQPIETWDPGAASDTVFGFNNWLLWEYDKWIDSLPEKQQSTSTGQPKKDAVRCSFYSYNYHDVPPNFNPDPRIRLMVASYPKNRGRGKWKNFTSQTDLAKAFTVMLPREPSGDYWIISLSYFQDRNLNALDPRWEGNSPEDLVNRIHEHYAAGFRALNVETDFNFGRLGLSYYLLAQLIWRPDLTVEELNAIRDRWLKRAFGSGWEPMKRYYDFRLSENYPVNSPHAWSRAIRMIDEASRLVDPRKEPDARRRLDDLKQFWYFYYLVDTGKDKPNSPAMRELLWKGQMSYINASHMINRSIFGSTFLSESVSEYLGTRAHYTTEETAQWWPKVLDHWPIVRVTRFDELTLSDGRPASKVDLNDLVAVEEFGTEPCRQGLFYNSGYMEAPTFLQTATRAAREIGFHLYWPTRPDHPRDRYYLGRDVDWGVSLWNPKSREWEEKIDQTMTVQPSRELQVPGKPQLTNVATVRYPAPQPGTYRFTIGRGGNAAILTDLGWDPGEDRHSGGRSLTFDGNAQGLTQSPVYIYIPRGTPTLDLEVWDSYKRKIVTLYKSFSRNRKTMTREVDVSARQTHRIELQPEETGTIAEIKGNGFAFPYLYSVPMLWAKSPGQLLVPRAVAEADGLTIRDN